MSSYYMKESTYRHDFIPQTKPRDDMRLPLNQERGGNDYRQDGPYTDRAGYYRNYNDSYHDDRYTNRQYDRREDPYRRSPDRMMDRRDYQNRSPERMVDRRDHLNRSPERGYNSYPSGPQTDRPSYGRSDFRDERFADRGYQAQDPSRRYPTINQTTQRDYGAMYRNRQYDRDRGNASPVRDFQQKEMEKMERERPRPYRGHLYPEEEEFLSRNRENRQPGIPPTVHKSQRQDYPSEQHSNSRDRPTVHPSNSRDYQSVQPNNSRENMTVPPNESKENRSLEHRRYMDEEIVDEVYLRPEEKQVRQRNMQQVYPTEQHLSYKPDNINEHRAHVSQVTGTGEVFLFIRARSNLNSRNDINMTFKKHKSELQQEGGNVVGMAPADLIYVMGDTSQWTIKSRADYKGVQWYQGEHDIYCIKFTSMSAASKWVDYHKDLKIRNFPQPDGVDIIIVPINYDPATDLSYRTFVMTFYPKIIDDGLKTHIENQTKDALDKDMRCHAFVASTLKSKTQRGSWLLHNDRCLVSLHAFSSLDDAGYFASNYRSKVVGGEKIRDFTRNGVQTTMMFQLQSFP